MRQGWPIVARGQSLPGPLQRLPAGTGQPPGERGLLDSTIVLVSGEFGRTAAINVNAGRDHWPNCFSLVVDGMFVKDKPVEIPDFVATLYKKLGVDYTKEYISNIGRLSDGKPLSFLL